MSVIIHQPETEALIQRRMATGAVPNVEAVLMESPLRGSGIEIERIKDYPIPVES